MSIELYVANLPEHIQEEQIRDLFSQYGTVESVKRLINQRTNEMRNAMLLQMSNDTESQEVMQNLNGHPLEPKLPVFVSPFKVGEPLVDQETIDKTTEQIIHTLGETEDVPTRQIATIIKFCGVAFAMALLDHTLFVDGDGGIETKDGTRKRTVGGIYFYLARALLSNKLQKMIFYIPGNRPKKQDDNKRGKRPGGKSDQRSGGKNPRRTDKRDDFKSKPKRDEMPEPLFIPKAPPEPEPTYELTPEVEAEFNALQDTLKEAQALLTAIQTGKSDRGGLFSATKEVWRIESRIKELQKMYPDLAN